MKNQRPGQPDPASDASANGLVASDSIWLVRCPCGGEVRGRCEGREAPAGASGCETWSVWCTRCDRPLRGPEVDPALAELAQLVLGSAAEADDWLSTPHVLLGDRSPRSVATTPEGARQVQELLQRLEGSLPA